MSLNFTVQKVEEYQGMPDGQYTAQVDHIEYKRADRGNYYVVNWKILSPSSFEGRVHQERYNVEHDNDQVRHIAINNFSRFCVEIGGLKEGDEPKEEDFLFKIATILIRNRIGKKDGNSYANIVKMELAGATHKLPQETVLNASIQGIAGSGMSPLEATGTALPLNDGVPF
jgi:hypothetical protein